MLFLTLKASMISPALTTREENASILLPHTTRGIFPLNFSISWIHNKTCSNEVLFRTSKSIMAHFASKKKFCRSKPGREWPALSQQLHVMMPEFVVNSTGLTSAPTTGLYTLPECADWNLFKNV